MKHILSLTLCLILSLSAMAQKDDYFYQIPEAPKSYSANHVLARMIDGLGFRYYWASFGLEQKDLNYSPDGDNRRSSLETLKHIDGLTNIARNTIIGVPTNISTSVTPSEFSELRSKTLAQLEEASKFLRNNALNPDQQKMIFDSERGSQEYPLWNLINGPISDALWHIGQVVSFRRSSGNPFPAGVGILQGSKRD
jgi:hypothetical protein